MPTDLASRDAGPRANCGDPVAGAALMLAVFAWMVAWVTLAFRRVYGDSTLAAAAKAIALSLAGVVVDNLVITLAFAVALRSL